VVPGGEIEVFFCRNKNKNFFCVLLFSKFLLRLRVGESLPAALTPGKAIDFLDVRARGQGGARRRNLPCGCFLQRSFFFL
jgi:hypothetical protein